MRNLLVSWSITHYALLLEQSMRVSRRTDRVFIGGTMALATSVLLVTVAILIGIANGASFSLGHFGLDFLTGQTWDPVQEVFGALPFIYGTLVTAAIAL